MKHDYENNMCPLHGNAIARHAVSFCTCSNGNVTEGNLGKSLPPQDKENTLEQIIKKSQNESNVTTPEKIVATETVKFEETSRKIEELKQDAILSYQKELKDKISKLEEWNEWHSDFKGGYRTAKRDIISLLEGEGK